MGGMKIRENAFLWVLALGAVLALCVGMDAGREPESFFVGIRVVVCFASAYAAVRAYKTKRETWAWLLGANAALYNPFVLVHLERDTWQLVYLADIALVIAAAVILRVKGEKPSPAEVIDAPVAAPTPPPAARQYRSPSRPEVTLWATLLILCLAGAALTQFYGLPDDATEAQKQAHSTQKL